MLLLYFFQTVENEEKARRVDDETHREQEQIGQKAISFMIDAGRCFLLAEFLSGFSGFLPWKM